MSTTSFAIVIVCYKRIDGIRQLLKSLEVADYNNCNDITLIFSIDNSGEDTVIDFAESYNWPHGSKIIRTFEERQGLKKHILSCGEYTKEYDIVVILEDDVFVSNSFYNYACQVVEFYKNDDNIAGFSLYSFQKNWLNWSLRFEPQGNGYDTFFMKIAQSWGQIWTKDKWQAFIEWYKQNSDFSYNDKLPASLFRWPTESSWLKFHIRYCIEMEKYFVYPKIALSSNSSLQGEHAYDSTNEYQVELVLDKKEYKFPALNQDAIIYDEYMNREYLGHYLGIKDEMLTIDFWGNKPKSLYNQFLLTSKKLDYKIIDEYALALRPIELNIVYGIKGNGIFLYDTTVVEHNNRNNEFKLFAYSSRMFNHKLILKYGKFLTFNYAKSIGKRLLHKIKNR